MGEGAKQEQTPAEETPMAEEKKTEEKEAGDKSKGAEEKAPPKPPSPLVLQVDLHCHGCTKKIERSILKLRGVEAVAMDMGQNQLTIKGVVEPLAVCAKIAKKTKRRAQVLSPLPAVEGDPLPDVVAGLMTVELNVDMHCGACAAQLKSKIYKMRDDPGPKRCIIGVRTVETELSSGKVTVTGTMDATKVVDYVYRRTKKQARIVPQPEPPPPAAPAPAPDEPKAAEEEISKGKEEGGDDGDADQKPSPEEANNNNDASSPEPEEEKEENAKDEQPPPEAGEEARNEESRGDQVLGGEESNTVNVNHYDDEDNVKMKMMMYYFQPSYPIGQVPPPQLFSDENPNACSIT